MHRVRKNSYVTKGRETSGGTLFSRLQAVVHSHCSLVSTKLEWVLIYQARFNGILELALPKCRINNRLLAREIADGLLAVFEVVHRPSTVRHSKYYVKANFRGTATALESVRGPPAWMKSWRQWVDDCLAEDLATVVPT